MMTCFPQNVWNLEGWIELGKVSTTIIFNMGIASASQVCNNDGTTVQIALYILGHTSPIYI